MLLNYLIFKNYKVFLVSFIVFLVVGIIFSFLERTYSIYTSEIKIFKESFYTESRNLLPYLYNQNVDEQNNFSIIADIISRDLIEGFIKKYNYNFKIISKEPKQLKIYDIRINKPLEVGKIYKVKTNTPGEIEITSDKDGFVNILAIEYYEAYNNFLRTMNIKMLEIGEIIGDKSQNNVLSVASTEPRVILITLSSYEPFINELGRKFKNYLIEYNLKKKIEKFGKGKEFISNQIENYLAELDILNYKIRTYQTNNNFLLDGKTNPMFEELIEIRKKKDQLTFEIQSLKEWLNNSIDENEIVTTDAFIIKSIGEIITLKDTLNLIRIKYGLNSPEYISVYSAYNKQKEHLSEKVRERIKNLETQVKLLEKMLKKIENEINFSLEIEREALSLVSRKKTIEDIITLLFQRMEEIKIQEAEIVPDIRILEFTEKPYISVKGRNWIRNILFSTLFSVFFSIAFIILKEYRTNAIKNADDIALKLDIKKIYLLPKVSDLGYLPFNVLKEQNYRKILEGHLYIESFRMLTLENELQNNTLFGITSSIQGEGKSFVSINLASTIAMMNKKVILLDCDVRKGDLTKLVIDTNNLGLSDLLHNDFENLIHKLFDNLYIISKGLNLIDPIAIFSSKRFEELLLYLKKEFDVVILDLPPVLRIAETRIIMDKADFVIFVMRADYTEIENVKSSLNSIPKEKLKAYILNSVDFSSSYGYRQKYYYRMT
ncbi:MAG: AAA family ATPase [candidate division WOR-3 bacterium]|nr:AAA family ATPase [candidate division WOR-3 bacterium]MDW8151232.1 AAA family ATPase [candidate division WOR-3 bacterium]